MTPTQPPHAEERDSRLLTLLLWGASALILFVLAWPLLTNTLYTRDDLGHQNIPFRVFYQNALHAGDSFLWNPNFFSGMYLYGEGQTGMAHPLHLLLYKTLPFTLAFNLEFILSYAATFLGMFLLLQRLELPRPSAILGAFLWAFSGFNLLHGIWINAVAVVAHIPWLLLVMDMILCTPNRRTLMKAQLAFVLLVASQLLLGWVQGVWFSLVIEGCFLAWRWHQSLGLPRLGTIVLGLAIGGLLGGIQLLPSQDMLHQSVRSAPTMAFRLEISLDPRNIIEMWSPYATKTRTYGQEYIHEVALYNGAFCTLSLAWLFLRRRSLGRWRSLTVALSMLMVVLFVFACGSYLGVYRFVAWLPVVNLFRGPARYIVLIHFVLAALAAIAFTDMAGLLARRERLAWRSLWPLGVPLVLGLVTTVLFATVGRGQNMHTWLQAEPSSVRHAGVGLCLVLLATLIVLGAGRGVRMSLYALPILLVADTFLWGIRYLRDPAPVSYARYIAHNPSPVGAVPGDTVYGGDWGNTDVLTLKGLRDTYGYAGFKPAKVLDAADPVTLRLAGARWAKGARYPQYFPVADPLPRARLVDEAQVSTNVPADVHHIDIARTALVDQTVLLGAGAPGTAQITLDRPGHVEIETVAPTRQLLVLSESDSPGWHVTEDGRSVPLLRAYGDFQACPVEAGTHHVVFHFAPDSLRRGSYLSLVGILAEIAVCLFLLRYSRPSLLANDFPRQRN